jgi:predicted phosphodiesterase
MVRPRDIGELEGKLLVFGGVYSNFQALEALKHLANSMQIPVRNILCTGDVVGYCAQPEECVRAVREWGIELIAGNVEQQLGSGETDCGCNFGDGSRCDLYSRQWYPFAQSKLSEESLSWMRDLPDHLTFSYHGRRVYLLHGSFFNTAEFIFRSTPWAVKQANFEATKADIILAGHCGLPFQHISQGKYWLNAGVIGMPANDGTPRVWCMTLEAQENDIKAQFIPFLYKYDHAATLMEQHQLPCAYSDTLRTGLWDNCDILPEEETRLQGIEMVVTSCSQNSLHQNNL